MGLNMHFLIGLGILTGLAWFAFGTGAARALVGAILLGTLLIFGGVAVIAGIDMHRQSVEQAKWEQELKAAEAALGRHLSAYDQSSTNALRLYCDQYQTHNFATYDACADGWAQWKAGLLATRQAEEKRQQELAAAQKAEAERAEAEQQAVTKVLYRRNQGLASPGFTNAVVKKLVAMCHDHPKNITFEDCADKSAFNVIMNIKLSDVE
jgi:hypothetical protein